MTDLRALAFDAFCESDVDLKLQRVVALGVLMRPATETAPHTPVALDAGQLARLGDASNGPQPGLSTLPGRPARPLLRAPSDVPQRSVHTPEGRAALMHAICHIEFNAINLALDAVWRFDGMPERYYLDWLSVAVEEAQHFALLRHHLQTRHQCDYGAFDAHDGLWAMCEKTAGDVTARMALVPRTLEARGLDATPLIQAKLRRVGTPDALEAIGLLDTILRDEVGHVAIGNRWYGWLCQRDGLEPLAHYRTLARRHQAPRPKPPLNDSARRAAGFTEAEMAELLLP